MLSVDTRLRFFNIFIFFRLLFSLLLLLIYCGFSLLRLISPTTLNISRFVLHQNYFHLIAFAVLLLFLLRPPVGTRMRPSSAPADGCRYGDAAAVRCGALLRVSVLRCFFFFFMASASTMPRCRPVHAPSLICLDALRVHKSARGGKSAPECVLAATASAPLTPCYADQ